MATRLLGQARRHQLQIIVRPLDADLLDHGRAMPGPTGLQLGKERLARFGKSSTRSVRRPRLDRSFLPLACLHEAAIGIPLPGLLSHQAVRRLNRYPARGVSHNRSPAAT